MCEAEKCARLSRTMPETNKQTARRFVTYWCELTSENYTRCEDDKHHFPEHCLECLLLKLLNEVRPDKALAASSQRDS